MAEKAQPGTLEEQSPSNIMIAVLGTLESQEEAAESESDNDKGGSNNVPITVIEENK